MRRKGTMTNQCVPATSVNPVFGRIQRVRTIRLCQLTGKAGKQLLTKLPTFNGRISRGGFKLQETTSGARRQKFKGGGEI